MRTLTAHPRARYAAPLAVAALAVGIGLSGGALTNAGADPGLAPRTAQQLLVDLQNVDTQTISGNVSSTANLGLPEGMLSDSASSDLQSLASGEHTLRVWADGDARQRLAVVGRGGESDVIRNGQDVWYWNSNDNSAVHSTLPAKTTATKPLSPQSSPQDLAKELLKSVDPTTEVTTSGTDHVAGRSVYELVLQPKSADTLVDRVQLAIDAATHVPLRVQVYSVRAKNPAIDVGYTKVSFDKPDASVFAFTPPPGAKVKEQPLPSKAPARPNLKTGDRPTVVGSGWNAVVVAKIGHMHAHGYRNGPNGSHRSGNPLAALPKVSGSWGSGRLLTGTLFSAVLTDDGRVAIGAVPAERLYSALTP
jgi:outer membrane lipoprotein-sorting protein